MSTTYHADSGTCGLLELEIFVAQLAPHSLLVVTHEGLLLELGPGRTVEPQACTPVTEDVAVAGVAQV